VPHLHDLRLLRANFVTYAFKQHMHDYFVIGVIEEAVSRRSRPGFPAPIARPMFGKGAW
jgi:hypothetical protein